MKALIIGAAGFIGSALLRAGADRHSVSGTYHRLPAPGLLPLDATDRSAVRTLLASQRPDWVFMPAANPNVDYCEQHPEQARAVNVDAVGHVAAGCAEVGARMLYFSSDYVFDGAAGPYDENDEPAPISHYGRQKREAELLLDRVLGDAALTLRVTVVYGWEQHQKNFFQRLITNLRLGNPTRAPIDQYGSPTEVGDLADAAWSLVERGAHGVLHVAGSEVVSRYAFALAAAEQFALPGELVQPVDTPSLNQPAARPLRAGMICARAEALIGRRMLGVAGGLAKLKRNEPHNS